jgi:hypothetical protein
MNPFYTVVATITTEQEARAILVLAVNPPGRLILP